MNKILIMLIATTSTLVVGCTEGKKLGEGAASIQTMEVKNYCNFGTSENQGVYGIWSSDEIQGVQSENPIMKTFSAVAIEDGTFIKIKLCSSKEIGTRMCTIVRASATITNSQIIIHESASDSQSAEARDKKIECAESIEAGTLDYYVDGNVIEINKETDTEKEKPLFRQSQDPE